jgi:hypothetical protein
MSACVNPSKENSTFASLLPVTVGKAIVPIATESVSMIVSTISARETEGATTRAAIRITVIT